MSYNIREPMAGDALSASWGRDMTREIRAQRLSVAPPLTLTRTPTGTAIGLRRTGAGGYGTTPRPWDVSFCGGVATLTNCCYMRGPVFVWLGTGTLDAAVTQADDGDTWMAAEIDTELGTVTVISGNAGDCVDAAPPAQDSVKVRIPLYILRATTDPETEEVSYSVLVDLRTCLAAVLYV